MNKKHAKRRRDIKTKLMAAICMLLVSSIMMVSTTYAWFTLSTAPEVKGINTAVGANGNLEMALQPLHGDSTKITSGVGDSSQPAFVKNTTWGNLVDVSDSNTYGLNNVMLNPSKLNTTETADGLTIGEKPLATPAYGADGRITTLESKTITGVFNSTEGKFLESYTGTINGQATTLNNPVGVRAIGISSGMSDRQLAYRAVMTAANTAASQAKRTASQSLNAKGAALADIAVKHATAGEDESYTVAELQSLESIINALLGNGTTTGALQYIEDALIDYALATGLGDTTGVTDDNYETLVTAFESVDITATSENLTTTMTTYGISIAAVTGVIDDLQTSLSNVEAAKGIIDDLLYENGALVDVNTTFEWADFSEALYKLADPDAMQINGIEVSNLKGNWKYKTGEVLPAGYYVADGSETKPGEVGFVYDEEQKIVSNMSRLVDAVLNDGIQLIIGSGAGVYADIADFCGDYSAAVTLSKIEYGGMTVKNLDATMSTKTSQATPYLTAAQTAVPAFNAGAGASASVSLNDFYGYIIDLAFRTNVAGSNLQLQGEAVDRIYSDGTNEATMGGGANMTFTSTVDTFTPNQVKNLMGCIRVVFFNTDNKVIIGYARLDVDNATTDATTGAVTMTLIMTDKDGKPILDDPDTAGIDESVKIMALEQNEIHELSVMVYLDGETITNADVANGVSSMTGTMNLQFSSSATLVPMEYTALKEGTGETPTTPTAITLTGVTSTDYTVGTAVYSNGAVVIQLTGENATEGTNVVVTIDGTEYETTIGTYNGVTGVSVTASNVEADSVITVAPKA